MLKAVLRRGVIVPLEPVPREWEEGASLEVARVHEPPADIDAWARSMNQLCADSAPGDEETMRRAFEEHRRQAKDQVWPIDLTVADRYAGAYHELQKAGRALSQVDILLAAMARHLKATLLTTDKDFQALPDVPTENWLAR